MFFPVITIVLATNILRLLPDWRLRACRRCNVGLEVSNAGAYALIH